MAIELQDLETYKGYLSKLKTEAAKVTSGVFVLFDKHKFKEGNKPLLLVGAKADKGLEKFVTTAGAKVKARGTCEATPEGLEFVAETGSLQTSEIATFGVRGKVKGEKEEVKGTGGESKQEIPETKQEMSDSEESTSEDVQTTPTTPFQKATPSTTQPKGKFTIGKDPREQAAQVQQFVKQRQDLLKFSQEYLETMTSFLSRAQSAATQAQSLVERADKGEQSEKLAGSLESALKNCQDILAAAQDANKTNGKEVVKGRGVNPGQFITDPTLAKATNDKYRHIFTQVASVTQQCSTAMADIELTLGEATRETELVLPLVKTGKADLKDLLAYLDKNILAVNAAIDKLEKAYMIRTVIDSLTQDKDNPKLTKEQLAVALSGAQETVVNRKRAVGEVYPRIQALCKSGLSRMKQGPQANPEILTRFTTIKDALTKATTWKREFDEGCKEFDRVAGLTDAKIRT